MRQNTVKMTTAQFAELHGVNRRKPHYYDGRRAVLPPKGGRELPLTTPPRALFLSISVC